MFVYRCVGVHGCSYTGVWDYLDVHIQVCGFTWMFIWTDIYKYVGLCGCEKGGGGCGYVVGLGVRMCCMCQSGGGRVRGDNNFEYVFCRLCLAVCGKDGCV